MSESEIQVQSLLQFIKRARTLANIDRCNQISKIKYYSVAEHSYFCVFLGMLFCDIQNKYFEQPGMPLINTEEVLRRLILHDIEESVIGDILYPIYETTSTFRQAMAEVKEKVVEDEVFVELPDAIKYFYRRLWTDAKDNTQEGCMVAAIDKFEILIFAIQEMEMGNTTFKYIYRNAIEILEKEPHFPIISKLVEVIKQIY